MERAILRANFNEGDEVNCPICEGKGMIEGTGHDRGTSYGCRCVTGKAIVFLDLKRGYLAESKYDFISLRRDRAKTMRKLLASPPHYYLPNPQNVKSVVRIGRKRISGTATIAKYGYIKLSLRDRKANALALIERDGYIYFEAAQAVVAGKPIPKRFRKK